MMKIYLMNVTPLLEAENFRKALSYVSPQRAEKVNRIKVRAEQARSLGAGLLLQYGLLDSGNTGKQEELTEIEFAQVVERMADSPAASEELPLHYGENGKPYLFKRGGRKEPGTCYFNLSHSGDYAVCAFCGEEIGVDLQIKKEPLKSGLSGHIFTQQENAMLLQCQSQEEYKDLFFFFFSAKEAYIKLTGQGMRQEMKELEVCVEKQAVFGTETKECLARLNRFFVLKDYSLVTARKVPGQHIVI